MTDQTPISMPRTQSVLRPFRSEAGPLIGLAVPLIAGSASFTLFGPINSIFLGPLGEVRLAAVSLTALTFATVLAMVKPWAASEAAALQESNGDEFPRGSQSVSPTPNQPHLRRKS